MKIGFIGVGNMAKAIINGWLTYGEVKAQDIFVHSAHAQNYRKYAFENHLEPVDSNSELANQAEVIFLAVKPTVLPSVLAEIKEAVTTQKRVLVSMVSGVSLAEIKASLGAGNHELLRIMPNINVELHAGMTALAKGEFLSEAHFDELQGLLNQLGKTTLLPEKDFSTFVALAGSSPAFIYLFIDAMARAGVKYGLTKKQATQIAAQAVWGSAAKVLGTPKTPWDLIDEVSSPGGTTVAGLLAMEDAGFMSAVVKGIDATIAKDQEKH
ncbi:pyrroline-5-carboxylate reductase [Liquorilactobacillus satsumensis]|uniref:Pyrroline-5-carboxylate reductase n=1 Tax=Liquorilactobacillus satsumensis DSM 16230 = JCM 12392 TaxID=1423801 RepID=A0A0R1V3T7_9LACO|nr:pyrroline-5-carboxylate reductase [Liquorilactobacillus satsumensis]KRM00272.1 pyrroline-5-carboxylate reductase [Liquorilactobacillus satsumensis DSM 16230 = JCM 12392]